MITFHNPLLGRMMGHIPKSVSIEKTHPPVARKNIYIYFLDLLMITAKNQLKNIGMNYKQKRVINYENR